MQTSGSTTQTTTYYAVGGKRVAADVNGTFYYFGYDALGSQVAVLNSTGSLVGAHLYGPYGSSRYSTGTLPTSIGFTGQRGDSVTGLDYYNARYYDPGVGQFLSADSVQGNAQGMDPYAYVGGNPETKTDPTGTHVSCDDSGSRSCGGGGGGNSNGGGNSGGGSTTTPTPPPSKPSGVPHKRYDLTSTQGRKACNHDVGCRSAMQKASFDHLKELALQAAGWGIFLFDIASTFLDNMDGPEEAEQQYEQNMEKVQLAEEEDQATLKEWTCSFTPQTEVSTDTGKKPIGTLKPGERVLAYNPKTQKMEFEPILHVWIERDNDLVDLTITIHAQHEKASKGINEVIHTNKKHPFLTVEKGFLSVSQIKLGMHVVEASGQEGIITGWKSVPGVKTMYNLEVEQDHTFTVGAGQWIVHNTGPECDDAEPSGQSGPVGSFNKVSDGYLKKIGIDAHAFKEGILGRGAPIAHFDIYKDGNGDLYLLPKGGLKSNAIPTYTNIDDPNP